MARVFESRHLFSPKYRISESRLVRGRIVLIRQ
jgi:hypothetical protein